MLSQTAAYAVRAMSFLAAREGDGPVLSQTIADAERIPKNFLSKILHRLAQAGLVNSARGANGGFVLGRRPAEINVAEIARLFMDLDAATGCFLNREACDGACGVHARWRPIAAQIKKLLENTTLDRVR